MSNNKIDRYQFGISTLVQNNFFRLEISVDDTARVKEDERLNNTSSVEAAAAVIKGAPETPEQHVAELSKCVKTNV